MVCKVEDMSMDLQKWGIVCGGGGGCLEQIVHFAE